MTCDKTSAVAPARDHAPLSRDHAPPARHNITSPNFSLKWSNFNLKCSTRSTTQNRTNNSTSISGTD